MDQTLLGKKLKPADIGLQLDIAAMSSFILSLQRDDGEIPWSQGGKTDPWDHVESAMGLAAAGYLKEAECAYQWLAGKQLSCGSWYYSYVNGQPQDKTREANMSTYIAAGILHHYLLTAERGFVAEMWPCIVRGINFALGLQGPDGEIYWAKDARGQVDKMALLTGSSSVFMSLKCALVLGRLLGKKVEHWLEPMQKLGEAIKNRPSLFNMIKSRFSMDWYYPVLCGAVSGKEARARISRQWEKFVVPNWGVRCVSDQPWVTLAETAELILALTAIDEYEQGKIVLNWISRMKYDDGSYWMGVTFPDGVIWPEERTSWTAAAIILAHDALYKVTPASLLFNHHFWKVVLQSPAVRNPQEMIEELRSTIKRKDTAVN